MDVVEAAEVAAGHLVPFLLFLPFLPFLYLQNLPLHDAAPASPSCHVMLSFWDSQVFCDSPVLWLDFEGEVDAVEPCVASYCPHEEVGPVQKSSFQCGSVSCTRFDSNISARPSHAAGEETCLRGLPPSPWNSCLLLAAFQQILWASWVEASEAQVLPVPLVPRSSHSIRSFRSPRSLLTPLTPLTPF